MSSLLAVGVGQFLVTKTKDQIKPPHTHGLPWLHPPDLPGVLRNGPVRAELATASDVVNGHLGPPGLVPVGPADLLLAGDVGLVVCQGEEPVVVEQHISDVFKLVLIPGTEISVLYQVHNLQICIEKTPELMLCVDC